MCLNCINRRMLETALLYFENVSVEKFIAQALPAKSRKRFHFVRAALLNISKVTTTPKKNTKARRRIRRRKEAKEEQAAVTPRGYVFKLYVLNPPNPNLLPPFEAHLLSTTTSDLFILKGDGKPTQTNVSAQSHVITYFGVNDAIFEELVTVMSRLRNGNLSSVCAAHVLREVMCAISAAAPRVLTRIARRISLDYGSNQQILWGLIMQDLLHSAHLEQFALHAVPLEDSLKLLLFAAQEVFDELMSELRDETAVLGQVYAELVMYGQVTNRSLRIMLPAVRDVMVSAVQIQDESERRRALAKRMRPLDAVSKHCYGFLICKAQLDIATILYHWRRRRNDTKVVNITISPLLISTERGLADMIQLVGFQNDTTVVQRNDVQVRLFD